jgi:pyroglutamyl-peptidase
MRVLLIGFGPFPGAPLNPSALLVKSLARRRRPAFAEIVRTSHVFTTTYAAVDRDLAKLREIGADIVLMFGLAGRRRHLCIETRARNAVSLLFPDASGFRPQRGVIAPGEPAALRGAAPFARLLGAVRSSAVPTRRSLEQARDGRPLVQFIHIPRVLCGSRRRPGRRPPRLDALVAAGERLLIALIAASRR